MNYTLQGSRKGTVNPSYQKEHAKNGATEIK